MVRLVPARTLIDMPVHPAADCFSMIADLDDDAMTGLINNIKAHGQLDPIITWNGAIVDGRNRYAACKQAGIRPRLQERKFDSDADCIAFIVSHNIHRRHLTESQRAMIASELAKLGRGGDHTSNASIDAMTQDEAAEQMQVSRASVQRARQVQEQAPDLAAKVKAGEMKVSKAVAMARERAKPTDPDRADDKVVDATTEAHADGYTKRMEAAWGAYWKLDDTERTAFHERQKEKKML